MSPRPAVQDAQEGLRDRILETFEQRAGQAGPRSVVMAELARELGISTRTLYQVFKSKAELVEAVMVKWARRLEAEQERRIRNEMAVSEALLEGALTLIDAQQRFSSAFWLQVGRDYPEAAGIIQRQTLKNFGRARRMVLDAMRDDVRAELAIPLYVHMIAQASQPKLCDQLGISRSEAVTEAVQLWCRAALRPHEADKGERKPLAADTADPVLGIWPR